jgi:GAF domain-containing protein
VTFIPNFADQVALAIQNARLRDSAEQIAVAAGDADGALPPRPTVNDQL